MWPPAPYFPLNPLTSRRTQVSLSPKFNSILRREHQKISYERRAYESVDEKSGDLCKALTSGAQRADPEARMYLAIRCNKRGSVANWDAQYKVSFKNLVFTIKWSWKFNIAHILLTYYISFTNRVPQIISIRVAEID